MKQYNLLESDVDEATRRQKAFSRQVKIASVVTVLVVVTVGVLFIVPTTWRYFHRNSVHIDTDNKIDEKKPDNDNELEKLSQLFDKDEDDSIEQDYVFNFDDALNEIIEKGTDKYGEDSDENKDDKKYDSKESSEYVEIILELEKDKVTDNKENPVETIKDAKETKSDDKIDNKKTEEDAGYDDDEYENVSFEYTDQKNLFN